jgi:hypothetical protein
MPRLCAAAFVASLSGLTFGVGSAAAAECYPHCDYIQDYGPYDYTYIRPGLFGYPICDWRGNCSPYPVYAYSGRRGGRITIRTLSPQR